MSESIEIKCILEDGAVPPEYKTTEAAGAFLQSSGRKVRFAC